MSQARYHVAHLRDEHDGAAVDAGVLHDVFRAPWEGVALTTLAPGEALGPRRLERSEALVFVTAGRGEAQLDSGPVALGPDVALTLFAGELLHLTAAADQALELFVAEMGTQPAR
jgi:mannose-6-phosphate isomerase-like protein (cupin superfamily)